jgi:cation transport ATPase
VLRDIVPARTLPADRPTAPSAPCAACGTLLDPLRTERVLVFEDGYRFLCDDKCLKSYRDGARVRPHPSTHSGFARSAATTPSGSPRAQLSRMQLSPPPELPALPMEAVWIGGASALLGGLVGLFAEHALAAHVSALLCVATASIALALGAPARSELGPIGWLLGPVGAALATLGAYGAVTGTGGTWLHMPGAAAACAAVLARIALDRLGTAPVRAALASLVHELPSRAHVPVHNNEDPLAMALDHVDVATIRTGEEIIARRGEVVAVDGVAQAGEARVLPFPQATTPVRRSAGDPVLAGARVVSGSLRLLATRVGDERALMRLSRIGTVLDRAPSPLARLILGAGDLGPLVACVLAFGAALLAPDRNIALSVAGSILIASPVLALMRSITMPAAAAAATGGARGIAFHSGRDLDVLGRASVVALQPHGVLTELRPVIVECHALDGSSVDALLALCAAAERVALPHPIARAVEHFVENRRVPAVEVRRAVHHAGLGVTALSPEGEPFVVGTRRLLLQEGISVAAADAEAARAETKGRVPIFIALGGRVRAVMTLQYELRVGARPAIQRLFDMGLEVVLLTGAHRGAVQELATALDIEHVKADLLPEERGQQVRSLRETGGTAAVIGRPADDDAALAAADAGIVLAGAGGSAADKAVALVSDDVRDAAAALWIARAAHDASLRGTATASIAFSLAIAAAATSLLGPGVAAVIAAAVDAYCLTLGPRLLRRIALRLPARS